MKIKSVELMRQIREKISQETNGMSWAEQQQYLKKHSRYFNAPLKTMPDKKLKPLANKSP